MPNNTTLLTHARVYANNYDWAIIPVRGKESACQWGRYQCVKPSSRQLIGLMTIPGVTGLAALVGSVSNGLRVRDFDQVESYLAWAEAHPDLATTLPTSKTGRGYHVFFRADLPDYTTKYDDGELRAGKGYVVLPPSAHPDGGTYEWLVPLGEFVPEVSDVKGAGLAGAERSVPGDVPPQVHEIITRTLPTGPGQRTARLWEFARRLKGVAGLDTSAVALEAYISEWYRRARPVIRSKGFEKTELAFYDAWTNAETPLTDDQFVVWIRPALVGPDPEWLRAVFFPESGKRLLRVCAALQERAGDAPFFLAARTAASVLGVEPPYVSELFKRLVKAGYLEVVEKGTYGTKLATTWLYKGPREETLPSSEPALAS